MEWLATTPLLFAAVIGFGHAFEADHLLAVSSIVTQRRNWRQAALDGIWWGLGHTSTILAVGLLLIVGRVSLEIEVFDRLEVVVGVMLVLLGTWRLYRAWMERQGTLTDPEDQEQKPHMAYGVGLVHGLAGSGAIVVLVMSRLSSAVESVAFLLIFGIGSVAGMWLAASLFSLPFSKRLNATQWLQWGLAVLSSVLCIGYGMWIIYEQGVAAAAH